MACSKSFSAHMYLDAGAKMKENLYATTALVAQRFSFVLTKLCNTEDTGSISDQRMLEFFYCYCRALVVLALR